VAFRISLFIFPRKNVVKGFRKSAFAFVVVERNAKWEAFSYTARSLDKVVASVRAWATFVPLNHNGASHYGFNDGGVDVTSVREVDFA